MPRVERPAPSSNIVCPSCGTAFSIAAMGKRRHVQCPKCREVVSLESRSHKAVLDALKAELAALRSEVERFSNLEARISALEQALGLRVVAQPQSQEKSSSTPQLRWLPRIEPSSIESYDVLDPKREEVLQHNLRQSPGKVIAIRSAAGDPIARQFAERLKSIFEQSSWRVVGVDEVVTSMVEHGLALAGGALPTPPDLASAYIAFTAAGFNLIPRLDPSLDPNDAVLIVA